MAQQRGRPRKNVNVENAQDVEFTEESIVGDEVMGEDFEPIVRDTKVQSDSGSVGEGTFGEYNPFAESVVERDYATPKTASGLVEDLEEPSFVPPSYEDIISDRQEAEATGANDSFENPFDNPNPAMNDLDNKDKKIACESLVDTVLDGYEQAHKYAQYIVKVDEETLLQKQTEGKLDLSMQVPVTETGETMSVGEFVAQYNEQSANALQYDKEFGYKVRPAMIRVFMKRGWGMTDEQFLMYMFGKDIAIKVGIMFQLKKTINGTLETLEKVYKRQNPNAGRGGAGQTEVYEKTTQGAIIEDDYDIEEYDEDEEDMMQEEPQEQFTSSMNINMPQNPVDPLKGHPKEVKNVLRNNK
jgi:hypothetical protein